ncbi:hypothetical protein [Nonomuraea basaltis]|uniref:hypothetical protein n=1 Tax=Nonomuraea basaltis TaxID=2495887 RepID=UPI00110C5116|nr:hypothetical protein [Nonomuraea basaltis]TMR88013.1 hypothetical protein EJK15_68585 [Nonomuraea basaltis]
MPARLLPLDLGVGEVAARLRNAQPYGQDTRRGPQRVHVPEDRAILAGDHEVRRGLVVDGEIVHRPTGRAVREPQGQGEVGARGGPGGQRREAALHIGPADLGDGRRPSCWAAGRYGRSSITTTATAAAALTAPTTGLDRRPVSTAPTASTPTSRTRRRSLSPRGTAGHQHPERDHRDLVTSANAQLVRAGVAGLQGRGTLPDAHRTS